METLRERLVELAERAPTGGAPPAELWARGKRLHRVRAAVAAAALVVVAAVGASIGVAVSDGGRDRSELRPAHSVGVSLPIEYPVGQDLPDLGEAPGPLLAIWVTPRPGGAPEVVGLVAQSGVFGTLPVGTQLIDAEFGPAAWPGVVLSPDGRRIAYQGRTAERGEALVVRDLVSGQEEYPTIEDHALYPYDWMDASHLYGIARGPLATSDADGWVWEPGTAAQLVDFRDYPYPGHAYLGAGWPYAGPDLTVGYGGPSQPCLERVRMMEATSTTADPNGLGFIVPVLCDVVGVVGTEVLLGHWNSGHSAGEVGDPKYPDGTVVALDLRGADRLYVDPGLPRYRGQERVLEDPARREVVVIAGAPHRVTLATALVAEALAAPGRAS